MVSLVPRSAWYPFQGDGLFRTGLDTQTAGFAPLGMDGKGLFTAMEPKLQAGQRRSSGLFLGGELPNIKDIDLSLIHI